MKKLIHSPAPWFAVQYANSFYIQTEDFYSESAVMDIEIVGEDIAETNAIIASKSPDMYKVLHGIIHHNNGVKDNYKLPNCLIEDITKILEDIETCKEKMNT